VKQQQHARSTDNNPHRHHTHLDVDRDEVLLAHAQREELLGARVARGAAAAHAHLDVGHVLAHELHRVDEACVLVVWD
jgi:hypothetical protein